MGYRVYFKPNESGNLACSPIYETHAEAEAEAQRLAPLFQAREWAVLLPLLSRECGIEVTLDFIDSSAEAASLVIRKVESPADMN